MKTIFPTRARSEPLQFSLSELFEYVTICSILAALSPLIGILASVLLMLLALAIWARAGKLAMIMLMAVLLAANAPRSPVTEWFPYGQQLLSAPLALAIAVWYGYRRTRREHDAANQQ